jgi:hypothetical protein
MDDRLLKILPTFFVVVHSMVLVTSEFDTK